MAYLTERELLERFEYYILQIEERLINGEDFETVAHEIPMSVSLNHPQTFEILNINKKHVEFSGFTLEETREKWDEYFKIVHPKTIKSIESFLPDFYATENKNRSIAFVQYINGHRDSKFVPYITFTKPSALPKGLHLWVSAPPEDFGRKRRKVEQIIKMDEFKLKHFKRFQQLTNREIEILGLLANGCNNPDIAERLFISRQTVETHRKNLKRKLELKNFRDLMKYAFAFNLVDS